MSRNRNFTFTYNNYPNFDLVDSIVCKYIAYSEEVAPTTGTPHLQGYIQFASAKTIIAARALLPGCHVEVMIGSIVQNDIYISKVGSMIERGDKPITNDNKGRAEKLRWHNARQLAKEGKLDEIDADIFIRCYTTLKRIKSDYQSKPPPVDVQCFWIYGPTGSGKSHAVECSFPDCYKKSMDDLKWFDGYSGHETIYLEDLDVYQVRWGGLLKRLADRWPMQTSVKGGMLYIRPKRIIVTSNYDICDIWTDPQTLLPLQRRFKVIHKTTQEQEIDFT
jgi:hypothetical protein